MWNLIKKDYTLIFAKKWLVLIFALLVPFILISGIGGEAAIYFIGVVAIAYANLGSIYIENNREDVLFRSLPIKRYAVILSKYIMIFLNYTIVALYTFTIFRICEALQITNGSMYLSFDIFKIILLVSIYISCILLPIIFSGTQKGGGMWGLIFIIYFYSFVINKKIIWNVLNYSSINNILGIMMLGSIILSFITYKKWYYY